MVKAEPSQDEAVTGLIEALGFTVTVTVKALPEQEPEVGVTVYVAVCTAFVGFVKAPEMFEAALPAAPPVIPPVTAGAGQL
jgi:hypothetical protein